MNKNIYIVLFVVIVLGIVFWMYSSSQKEKTSPTSPATVATLSVVSDTSSASAVLSGAKTVIWQTTNYPTDVGVNINLIRKISDSPNQFVILRAITTDTPNDGQETWIPQDGENTSDLYVEVTCLNTYQFTAGCSIFDGAVKVN